MEDNNQTRKPLSSASEIMSRHTQKKKRRWLHNILHGDTKTSEDRKRTASRSQFYADLSDKSVSRSLENIGNLNLSVIGFPRQPERALSDMRLPQEEDNLSLTSASSCESDSSFVFRKQNVRNKHKKRRPASPSSCSSDTDYVSECETVESVLLSDDTQNSEVPSAQESAVSTWFNYLPFSVGYNRTDGSTDSLNSQSEERKTLSHILEQSDSDQVNL